MRARLLVLGALAALGGPGCLGAVPLKPRAYDEAVRVESLDVDFQADGSGLLDVGLQVKNPASDAATLTSVDFELWVDGRRVATGQQHVDAALPPQAEVPLRVLFPLSAERVVPVTAPLPVRLRGGVVLRFGGTERRASFRVQGSRKLTHVPPLEGMAE
ncbi:LEA type 2 family protein [Myxococcus sp. K38C18041901]|uniref:NDR1/HIN1-like protein n=1 Tax=Myxococcus guangdongensis TaxID=2906760 RepID=UPI0020A7A69A|nr:LEA type 2 family protein [Myxococcus guangdongensis]MCP3058317.1 LEA type 2 family protein [Myxococcus guangdongensis]